MTILFAFIMFTDSTTFEIFFDSGKAITNNVEDLEKLAQIDYAQIAKVQVKGFVDTMNGDVNTKRDSYQLSKSRAEWVKEQLLEIDVPEKLISISIGGIEAENKTACKRRRVEISLLMQEETICKQSQIIDALPRTHGIVKTIVVTVPKPEGSSMGKDFDTILAAQRRALEIEDYSFVGHHFAWEKQEKEKGSKSNPVSESECKNCTSWVLFQRYPSGQNDEGRNSAYAVLFLVPESPLLGINYGHFKRACDKAREFPPWNEYSLYVLGPCYSGSAYSLGQHLMKYRENNEFCGKNYAMVISGSATSNKCKNWIENPENYPETEYIKFIQLSHKTDELEQEIENHLESLGIKEKEIAMLVETSPYGQDFRRKNEQSNSIKKFDPKTYYFFPINLTSILSTYEPDVESNNQKEDQTNYFKSNYNLKPLDLNLKENKLGQDNIKHQERYMTARSMDLTLRQIIHNIEKNGFKAVGIVSTNPLDVLFLVSMIKKYHSGIRIFVLEYDLLYTHPSWIKATKGTIITSSYDPYFELQEKKKSKAFFSTDRAQGAFQALSKLIKKKDLSAMKKPFNTKPFLHVINGDRLEALNPTPNLKPTGKQKLQVAGFNLLFLMIATLILFFKAWVFERSGRKTSSRGRLTFFLTLSVVAIATSIKFTSFFSIYFNISWMNIDKISVHGPLLVLNTAMIFASAIIASLILTDGTFSPTHVTMDMMEENKSSKVNKKKSLTKLRNKAIARISIVVILSSVIIGICTITSSSVIPEDFSQYIYFTSTFLSPSYKSGIFGVLILSILLLMLIYLLKVSCTKNTCNENLINRIGIIIMSLFISCIQLVYVWLKYGTFVGVNSIWVDRFVNHIYSFSVIITSYISLTIFYSWLGHQRAHKIGIKTFERVEWTKFVNREFFISNICLIFSFIIVSSHLMEPAEPFLFHIQIILLVIVILQVYLNVKVDQCFPEDPDRKYIIVLGRRIGFCLVFPLIPLFITNFPGIKGFFFLVLLPLLKGSVWHLAQVLSVAPRTSPVR